ncbi:protein PFC0760c-like [Pararge aegeria]|uniref:protein PFC0760c-like n=1 Tax=Pararge aegeria TaxID=116150 RepID=UPI0019D0B385|nr:protein PFC0760c-like [Pararge aegeria]
MSLTNVFSNTSDTKTIIRFVKEIERHPCLYDRKSPKYMDRELKRKTWIYIAKKANSTVADCKDKWTKIRTAYIRTLRPSYNAGVRTFSRPYYLANYLKFIPSVKRNNTCKNRHCPSTSEDKHHQKEDTNYIETNKAEEEESEESEDNNSSPDEDSQHQVLMDNDNNNSTEDNDDDDDDDDSGGDNDDDDGITGYNNIVIDKKETAKNEINKSTVKDAINRNESSGKTTTRMPCSENIESNPRKMFLFSLLPDIEDLNEQQMRRFRREVIKLIDNVMYN